MCWSAFVGAADRGCRSSLFRWDWLIPFVEPRASAALGRPVTIAHLHVTLGRTTHIVADGVTIGNPPDWPGGGDFATAEHLTLDVDADGAVSSSRQVVLPSIDAGQAGGRCAATGGWARRTGCSAAARASAAAARGEDAADRARLRSTTARRMCARRQAGRRLRGRGRDAGRRRTARTRSSRSAKGTYAKQPITAEFTGGALLSLRDASEPYPVDLQAGERADHGVGGRDGAEPAGLRRRQCEAGAGRAGHVAAAAADRDRDPEDAAVSGRRASWTMPTGW